MQGEYKTYNCENFTDVNSALEEITKDVFRNTADIEVLKRDVNGLNISVNKNGFIEEARKEFSAFMKNSNQIQRNVELFAEEYPKLVKHIDQIIKMDVESFEEKTEMILGIDIDDIVQKINEIKTKINDHEETISTYIGNFEESAEKIVETKTQDLNTDGTILAIKKKIEEDDITINQPPPVVEQTPMSILEFLADRFYNNPILAKDKTWRMQFLGVSRIKDMRKNSECVKLMESIDDKESEEYFQVITPYFWESACNNSPNVKKYIDDRYQEYVENFKLCVQEKLNNNL